VYTPEELTEEVVREYLIEVGDMNEKVEALREDERCFVCATLPGNSWTAQQVARFIGQAEAWSDGKTPVRIMRRDYRGLELVKYKDRKQLEQQVVDNEVARRQTSNYDEKRLMTGEAV